MDSWQETYEKIVAAIAATGTQFLFYRGHCDAKYRLMPSLGRLPLLKATASEDSIYFDFVTRAGELLPRHNDSWANLFAMQHHGLPTRLLDWTETLGVALYFALKSGKGNACIWILNPFALNEKTINSKAIVHPTELNGDYREYYIARTKHLEGNVVAISPLRHFPRVFHQRAGFTLHDDLTQPLDKLHADVVTKITIPASARAGGEEFLRLAGISEFSLFPDLDGLARELNDMYF